MDSLTILQNLINEGEKLAPSGGQRFHGYNESLQPAYVSWRLQSITAIEEIGKNSELILKDILSDKSSPYFYTDTAQNILGALRASLEIVKRDSPILDQNNLPAHIKPGMAKIFIVHGHDKTLSNQVNLLLTKLGLQPIILFEQPGHGKTIIEKLEQFSEVSFAIVLLTPDDLGKNKDDSNDLKYRSRQNVVFELGFFVGKLGRSRVVALYDEKVELPSDYNGVEYIKIDSEEAWKIKLSRELKAAKFEIDLNKIL